MLDIIVKSAFEQNILCSSGTVHASDGVLKPKLSDIHRMLCISLRIACKKTGGKEIEDLRTTKDITFQSGKNAPSFHAECLTYSGYGEALAYRGIRTTIPSEWHTLFRFCIRRLSRR